MFLYLLFLQGADGIYLKSYVTIEDLNGQSFKTNESLHLTLNVCNLLKDEELDRICNQNANIANREQYRAVSRFLNILKKYQHELSTYSYVGCEEKQKKNELYHIQGVSNKLEERNTENKWIPVTTFPHWWPENPHVTLNKSLGQKNKKFRVVLGNLGFNKKYQGYSNILQKLQTALTSFRIQNFDNLLNDYDQCAEQLKISNQWGDTHADNLTEALAERSQAEQSVLDYRKKLFEAQKEADYLKKLVHEQSMEMQKLKSQLGRARSQSRARSLSQANVSHQPYQENTARSKSRVRFEEKLCQSSTIPSNSTPQERKHSPGRIVQQTPLIYENTKKALDAYQELFNKKQDNQVNQDQLVRLEHNIQECVKKLQPTDWTGDQSQITAILESIKNFLGFFFNNFSIYGLSLRTTYDEQYHLIEEIAATRQIKFFIYKNNKNENFYLGQYIFDSLLTLEKNIIEKEKECIKLTATNLENMYYALVRFNQIMSPILKSQGTTGTQKLPSDFWRKIEIHDSIIRRYCQKYEKLVESSI